MKQSSKGSSGHPSAVVRIILPTFQTSGLKAVEVV